MQQNPLYKKLKCKILVSNAQELMKLMVADRSVHFSLVLTLSFAAEIRRRKKLLTD
jgi:hypothetical protein